MNNVNNVTPMPQYAAKLGQMQWKGEYWGEEGALEYARRYEDLVKLTPVGWVSLWYSAAGNARMRWEKNKLAFWWLFLFVSNFCRAFFKARELTETKEILTPQECSVVGVVLRHGKLTQLAVQVLEHGLSATTDEQFAIRALLYAELYEMRRMSLELTADFIWGLHFLPRSYEQAKKPCGKIAPEQLARVLRKVGLCDFAARLAAETESWDQVLKSHG